MDKEYVMQAVETAIQQLLATTQTNVLMSWGIERFLATEFKEMPTLMFHVNGRLFKGYVYVALNEGDDYYEIYLRKDKETETVLLQEEVCFDEMGDIIDKHIERGTNKEEYNQFCEQEYKKLIC